MGSPSPLDVARKSQGKSSELILRATMWSTCSHELFPAEDRQYATAMLQLGYRLAWTHGHEAQSAALVDLWRAYVLPQLVVHNRCASSLVTAPRTLTRRHAQRLKHSEGFCMYSARFLIAHLRFAPPRQRRQTTYLAHDLTISQRLTVASRARPVRDATAALLSGIAMLGDLAWASCRLLSFGTPGTVWAVYRDTI